MVIPTVMVISLSFVIEFTQTSIVISKKHVNSFKCILSELYLRTCILYTYYIVNYTIHYDIKLNVNRPRCAIHCEIVSIYSLIQCRISIAQSLSNFNYIILASLLSVSRIAAGGRTALTLAFISVTTHQRLFVVTSVAFPETFCRDIVFMKKNRNLLLLPMSTYWD